MNHHTAVEYPGEDYMVRVEQLGEDSDDTHSDNELNFVDWIDELCNWVINQSRKQNKVDWNNTCEHIIRHIETKYNCPDLSSCSLDIHQATFVVIRHGKLNLLRYLHQKGIEMHNDQAACAIRAGQLSCLKYIHENGCSLENLDCKLATELDSVDCLRYMHEHGCLITESIYKRALITNAVKCVQYAHQYCPITAPLHIHLLMHPKEVSTCMIQLGIATQININPK